MTYGLDGNRRSDLEHELNGFVPKQDNLVVVRGILLGSVFGALTWAVILFLIREFFA